MIFNNYKKLIDQENKIIDIKNTQKFICNIDKNLKIFVQWEMMTSLSTHGEELK